MTEENPLDLNALDVLLTDWHEAEKQKNYWVEKERILRQQIFERAFAQPKIGTNKVRISHGMALIGDYRINYRIDQAALEASRGFIPPETFDAVVNYRPEIRNSAYRKLEPKTQLLFSPFVTETPGTPGLEIKPANKVRW